jgi:nucleoid-associated protein EbfC
MRQLLEQAQRLQQQLADAQEELISTRVRGTAGGGLVTATVLGSGQLVDLAISPEVLAGGGPGDAAETVADLADLVLAAVQDATENAAALQQEAMNPLTEGLGALGGDIPATAPIPPGGLPGPPEM